jgi:hypothetical protein
MVIMIKAGARLLYLQISFDFMDKLLHGTLISDAVLIIDEALFPE